MQEQVNEGIRCCKHTPEGGNLWKPLLLFILECDFTQKLTSKEKKKMLAHYYLDGMVPMNKVHQKLSSYTFDKRPQLRVWFSVTAASGACLQLPSVILSLDPCA